VSGAGKAGQVPAAAMGGIGELDRARLHVERAVAELKAARQAWGCWADGIRQRAEQRLGITDLADQHVMDDPEYAWALDLGGPYIEAVNAVEAALKAGRSRGGPQAPAQSPGGLDGDAVDTVPAGLPVLPGKHK